MSETAEPSLVPTAMSAAAWSLNLDVAVCEACHWRYLAPGGTQPVTCPHCFQRPLTPLPEGLADMPHPYPPEQILPFSLAKTALGQAIGHFTAGIPYPPTDLNPDTIRGRLAPVFLPVWLVDANVTAGWQANLGFDYEVVSHQEHFDQDRGGWQTREIREPRVRWESRAGRLNRAYQNISTPAIDDFATLVKQLGTFDQSGAQAYQRELLGNACVRLPDHPPKESWNEAAMALQKTAQEDCREACAAGHIREFRWKAQFTQLNWTLLLLPVYMSYYHDDEGRAQPILIHGQTGQVTGARRSSMRQAQRTSLILFLTGLILFVIGLLSDRFTGQVPGLGALAVLTLFGGAACLLATLVPVATAWNFNRKH